MVDVHDKKTRSRNMAAIKRGNTKPELWLRKRLHALGFRYRVSAPNLPGKPDIVLPKYHAAIFVHGCFWHAHKCHLFKLPATRTEWWKEKLYTNRARDIRTRRQLISQGWKVLVVWECAIKGKKKITEEALIQIISYWILNNPESSECSGIVNLAT